MKLSTLLLFSMLFLYSCSDPGESFPNAMVIEHINTIDAENGVNTDMTVIVEEGKILKVIKSAELKVKEAQRIIDGTGKFLIPGLWDAHVHFAYIEELAPYMFDLFLIHGITSVRDTGGEINFMKKWKDASLADPLGAPRVMIAGPLIDGMPNVYDGSSPTRPPLSKGNATTEDIVNTVNMLDSMGVDLLKAYEMLSPDQYRVLLETANLKGLKVTGHVPLSLDVITASDYGLNSMEHMRNLELSVSGEWETLLQERQTMLEEGTELAGGELRSSIHSAQRSRAINSTDEEQKTKVLDALAKNETWQIPTLALSTGAVRRHFDKDFWKESFNYLPDEIQSIWRENSAEFALRDITDFQKEYMQWQYNMVKDINAAGIGIMAGTDTPIFFLTPGLSLHEELVTLVDAGLTPMEALKSATFNPAQYFNMEDELGLIQEGMWADLIILDADPLVDIRNTSQINSVIKQGQLYDQMELDRIKKLLKGK